MNLKFLFCALAIMPMAANAAIPYRVEQTTMPSVPTDDYSFAKQYPFYIGASYNFSMWDNFTDDTDISVSGKNTSSFDIATGYRVSDIFRLEATYIHTDAKWNAFSMTGDTVMINAIFDARMNSIYRIFGNQHIVPYVGIGGGASWVNAHDTDIKKDSVATIAALAGISFEFGGWWAFDFGYRYFYMFTPEFTNITDMTPSAHQFRAGARFSF